MQFWQTRYPEDQGSWIPGGNPRVHAGFLTCWHQNGFGARIVEKICDIVREKLATCPKAITRVFVTGERTYLISR